MTRSRLLKLSLFISGLILTVGGGYTLTDPHGFYAENGALLGIDVNLLNCVRATGTMLLTFGVVIGAGLGVRAMTFTSSLTAVTVFGFYGSGRLTSILVDGMPSAELVQGTTIEFIVAAFALAGFLLHGRSSTSPTLARTPILKAVLLGSGSMLVVFGAATLAAPQFLYGIQQVELGNDVNILNFARAQGSTFLGCGLVIVAGAFIDRLTFASTTLSAAVFMAYGVGRAISIGVDGVPAPKLVQGTFIELAVGLVVMAVLYAHARRTRPSAEFTTREVTP